MAFVGTRGSAVGRRGVMRENGRRVNISEPLCPELTEIDFGGRPTCLAPPQVADSKQYSSSDKLLPGQSCFTLQRP